MVLAAAFVPPGVAQLSLEDARYSRLNSLGIFSEYSNDSSPILLGSSVNRKLATFGFSYTRRVVATRQIDLYYLLELRPVFFESDPELLISQTVAGSVPFLPSSYTRRQPNACRSSVSTSTITLGMQADTVTTNTQCGRGWTFGEAFSPVGLKLNLRRSSPLQPVLSFSSGYAFSTRPIPVDDAGSFNYLLAFGAGFEYFLSPDKSKSFFGNRSIRVEYRYHHISNASTAAGNPGVDSGLFQVSYSFGR